MNILVTGGTGFIGSHACVELLQAGHQAVVVDNLVNSEASVIERIGQICGQAPVFFQGDLRDSELLDRLFSDHPIDAVMHFAGLKAVGESTRQPLAYYDNNVIGSLSLLAAMARHQVRTLVFSSSCTVYGEPQQLPVDEQHPQGETTNPYGETKRIIERILTDFHAAAAAGDWSVALLRYFNPVGAHPSGLIGEAPLGEPEGLMPYLSQVAAGQRKRVRVFGDDYPTVDGTGVRDYIHVVDLAIAHLRALEYMLDASGGQGRLKVWNLGSGRGYSVLEVLHAFEKASGQRVPFKITGRRAGDIAETYADPGLANRELDWQTTRDLDTMCQDFWRWQQSAN